MKNKLVKIRMRNQYDFVPSVNTGCGIINVTSAMSYQVLCLIFKLDQKKHSDLYQADVCNPHTMTKPLRWCNAWLACSPRVRYIVGSRSDRVKPKTIKLVFVDTPLSTQH